MKKRLLSLTLIAALCLSLFPVGTAPAQAAVQHDHNNGWHKLSTTLHPDSSSACYIDSGSMVLTDDTYLVDDATRLIFRGNTTLCLNGHTLNLLNGNAQRNCSIEVQQGANVTICDCSDNPGKIVNQDSFMVNNGASLTLSDVTVDGSQTSSSTENCALYVDYNASLTINSGTITGAETGISAGGCAVTMNGGTVNGAVYVTGMMLSDECRFTLTGGTINGRVWLGSMDGRGTDMEMSGGTITGGNAENGGGIFVADDSTCTISGGSISNNKAESGGGVYVEGGGALTVQSDAQITSNNATSGGGVYVASGGSCTINDGAITQNTATSGGGVYSEARLDFNGGTISENNAGGNGGGIYAAGDGTELGSDTGVLRLTNNTATGDGGGMYLAEDTTGHQILGNDTLISENKAVNGGGVYVADGQLVMNSGTISQNTATGNGGGIYAGDVFVGRGGTISGNQAANGGGLYVAGDTTQLWNDITGNTATQFGGGVYVTAARFFLRDGEVSNNTAQSGGGLFLSENVTTADFIPDAGKSISITGNQAANIGGGIYSIGGVNLRLNAVLQNNTAASGGGVYVASQYVDTPWTATIAGGELSGNTATSQGSDFHGVNGTFNVTGGTLKKSNSAVKSIYLDTVDGTVTGGYWDDPADMVEVDYNNKAVLIRGGYFSEKPEERHTGFYVDPYSSYTVTQIDASSGDSNYREGYPWAVYLAPTFTLHPQSLTVEENGNAVFTAEATGSGTITYTWQAQPKTSNPYIDEWYDIYTYSTGEVVVYQPYRGPNLYVPNVSGNWQDNEKILRDDSGFVRVSSFDPKDARFRCVAEGSNGAISYSNPAELTVTSAPASTITSVTVTPDTATIQTGGTQQFTATVSGTGAYDETVAWSVSGNQSNRTTIDQNGLLTVGADETAATLTVRATANGDSTKSGTATVTVEAATPPPTITGVTVTPTTATVQTSDTQQFTAEVSGTGDYGETVTWSVEGAVSNGTTISTTGLLTVGADETAVTLTVTATSNGDNTKSGTATVTVEAAPVLPTITGVTVTPATATIQTGGTQQFTAEVSGTGAYDQTVTWSVSGNQSNGTTIDQNGLFTVGADETAATLTVTAISNGDSTKSGTATVTVEPEPEPITHSIQLSAEPSEGGSVSGGGEVAEGTVVTVTATANEGYTFTGWQENGSTVSTAASYTFTATADRSLVALFEKEEPDNPPEPVDPDEPDEPDNPSDPSEPADPSEPTTPAGPATDNSDGWTAIEDELDAATGGDTITVDMNGTTDVPAAVFETVAGKDVDVTFELEGGVSWTVNGQDIPEGVSLSDLDLGVTLNSDGIPVDVINTITDERDTVQMTLAHDGDFGFTMTLTAPLGAENAGYWANLYHFDEDAERLTFETAAEIDADGSVSLSLSHASQYAIVIDDHSHATIDLPFSDVSAGDWFYDPVCYVYAGGLMTGVSDTAFAPEATTTRAMIVSMLARMENVTSAADAGFTDVEASDWYATAVNWAASEGIVGGFGDGTFQPNAAITREQMASILYRYAEYKGLDVSARTDLSHYSDQPSAWAEDVMQWAVAEGLLAGVTDDQLQPQGQATRAQVAAIFERFLEA